jgi:hypothetical protein
VPAYLHAHVLHTPFVRSFVARVRAPDRRRNPPNTRRVYRARRLTPPPHPTACPQTLDDGVQDPSTIHPIRSRCSVVGRKKRKERQRGRVTRPHPTDPTPSRWPARMHVYVPVEICSTRTKSISFGRQRPSAKRGRPAGAQRWSGKIFCMSRIFFFLTSDLQLDLIFALFMYVGQQQQQERVMVDTVPRHPRAGIGTFQRATSDTTPLHDEKKKLDTEI